MKNAKDHAETASTEGHVSSRCVLYVSGFDPRGARYYHALYQAQGALQSELDGWALRVGPRRTQTSIYPYWELDATIDNRTTRTLYEFMRWDDVVRVHWTRRLSVLWRDIVVTTARNLHCGAWYRQFKLAWPPALTLLLPFLLLVGQGVGIPLISVGATVAIAATSAPPWLALVTGFMLAGLLWAGGRPFQKRYGVAWLARSYAFTTRLAKGQAPEMDVRLDAFADHLIEKVRSCKHDEVLIVGHSSGAMLAASMVARALSRSPGLLEGPTRVGLLTLGQCLPLLGLLPEASGFRRELQVLERASGLTWADFSSPADGSCFALMDPIASCGMSRAEAGGIDLKILNPRFANLFDPKGYAALKREKVRLHFQYLGAGDLPSRPGGYSYFALTAGPLTLEHRFASVPSIDSYTALRPFRRP